MKIFGGENFYSIYFLYWEGICGYTLVQGKGAIIVTNDWQIEGSGEMWCLIGVWNST